MINYLDAVHFTESEREEIFIFTDNSSHLIDALI